jgi:hypothetical protein
LIGWVEEDAAFIADRIAEYESSQAPAYSATPAGAGASARARSTERN